MKHTIQNLKVALDGVPVRDVQFQSERSVCHLSLATQPSPNRTTKSH
jgi:hypothetical protein